MNISRTLITAASAAALCVTAPTAVEATPEPAEDPAVTEWLDTRCFAPLNGSFDPGVWVYTFELVDSSRIPGAGTTSAHLLPCLPTDCPDGLYLGSGGCMTEDPFAHLPNIDTPATGEAPAASAPDEPEALDVGPLIEPAIATPTS